MTTYYCDQCKKTFNDIEKIECPECGNKNIKKRGSLFFTTDINHNDDTICKDGICTFKKE